MEDYPIWLRGIRESKGIKQTWIEQKAGLSASTITQIETGRRRPTAEQVIAIARALGEDINYSLFRAGYITEDETVPGLAEIFKRPSVYEITQALLAIEPEKLKRLSPAILSFYETLKDLDLGGGETEWDCSES